MRRGFEYEILLTQSSLVLSFTPCLPPTPFWMSSIHARSAFLWIAPKRWRMQPVARSSRTGLHANRHTKHFAAARTRRFSNQENEMPRPSRADPNEIAKYRQKPLTGYCGPTRMCQVCKEYRPMKGGKVTGPRYNDGLGTGFIKGSKTKFVCAKCLAAGNI